MKTQVHEKPPGSTLTDAYVQRTDERTRGLFPFHPEEAEDWDRRAALLDAQADARADSTRIAEVLAAYNRRHSASAQTMEAIRELGGGALAVVGGQQAGLWGGPLMIIHKAVTIISAAREARGRLGRPVVPVFWIAGEDHDWEEACHTYLPEQGKLRKLAIARPPGSRTSVSQTRLVPSVWEQALDELAALLQDTLHKPALVGQLRQLMDRSSTLSEQLAGILSWLFADEGLILLDADDPELRRLESPMLLRLLKGSGQLEDAYRAAAADVTAWGYGLQAEVEESSANLFYYRSDDRYSGGGERTKLYRTDEGFADRRGLVRLTHAEAAAAAMSEPERFSNNVLTRPLMQDYVLPVLAAVLGPGEIAYWGITGRAFRLLGMEMPMIIPRLSFTIIDEATAKHMHKYDMTLDDVMLRFEERRDSWLASQDDTGLEARFQEVQQQMMQHYDPLLAAVAGQMPGLSALAAKNREILLQQVDYMRKQVHKELQRRHDVSLRQLQRIRLMLYPGGVPQERVLNFTMFWNRYGGDWLRQLLAVPFDPRGRHRIVYL
ncbi:bacillithiol biosynthesis cysteine-adding enzyme BshC [Paenibacillus sp. 1P07SE]|uniref:bacillithiol biosynthesis cysteine-adding enzyme BshC n=1 Tax=Paenibacillus sp. 1P07SE TaxID=3132209 RepID=UPI0039A5E3F2